MSTTISNCFQAFSLGTLPASVFSITLPRPVYKNSTAMVTKQVHKRQLLLSENEVVRQVVLDTMAYCAKHYNIALHSIMMEGNHYHRADTDADAKRPLFNRTCHALIAKQLNVYYKERDALHANQTLTARSFFVNLFSYPTHRL